MMYKYQHIFLKTVITFLILPIISITVTANQKEEEVNKIDRNRMAFNSIRFYDKHNGFAGGSIVIQNGTKSEIKGVLLKTGNGGDTWDSTILPGVVKSISILSAEQVVVLADDGFIFVSSDSGKNWQGIFTSIPIHTYSRKLSAVGDNVVHGLLVSFCGPFPNTKYSDFHIVTSDAGYSWKLNKITPQSSAHLYGISFLDNSTGKIVGTTKFNPLIKSKGIMLTTTDGGRTWKQTVFEKPDLHVYLQGIRMLSKTHIIIIGNVQFQSSRGKGLILQKKGTEPYKWFLYDELNFQSIDFNNEKEGILLANNLYVNKSYIFKTANGGDSWDQIAVPDSPRLGYTDVELVDEKFIYLVGAQTILKSDDGGITWNPK